MVPDNFRSGSESRATGRVNLFMAATLHACGVETAVKIRDLSAVGAQIETPLLPTAGTHMILSRGRLSVEGHVAWSRGRRCGLKFSSKIAIPDWMANPVNRHQNRVDHIVTAVKAGVPPLVSAISPPLALAEGVAPDLENVARLLGNLGDALANDPAIIAQHGIALQNLDIAMQMLAALAEVMQSERPVDAARAVRLTELRTSCAEALRNGG